MGERQLPPRSMVWLGAWNCHHDGEACRVHFEPSEAPLPWDWPTISRGLEQDSVGLDIWLLQPAQPAGQ